MTSGFWWMKNLSRMIRIWLRFNIIEHTWYVIDCCIYNALILKALWLDKRFHKRCPCIIIIVMRMPCTPTWIFLSKIAKESELLVVALMGCNLYKLYIYFVYWYGSMNMSYDTLWLFTKCRKTVKGRKINDIRILMNEEFIKDDQNLVKVPTTFSIHDMS